MSETIDRLKEFIEKDSTLLLNELKRVVTVRRKYVGPLSQEWNELIHLTEAIQKYEAIHNEFPRIVKEVAELERKIARLQKCIARSIEDNPVELSQVPLDYETPDGNCTVLLWSKWPSYDFIFAVPDKDHKLYGIEAGLFMYRNRESETVNTGFYVDKEELHILIDGFDRIKNENNG